jgi:hypothetical protein
VLAEGGDAERARVRGERGRDAVGGEVARVGRRRAREDARGAAGLAVPLGDLLRRLLQLLARLLGGRLGELLRGAARR